MKYQVGLLVAVAATLSIVGCSGGGDNGGTDQNNDRGGEVSQSAPGVPSTETAEEDAASTLDGVVHKEIGEVGGAFCDTDSADDPKDWDCEVRFTVTAVTIGDTCAALGFGGADTYFEPDQTLIRVDTDLEFDPDASHDATLFTALANWESVDSDGYSSPLSTVSDCLPEYSGNNTWSSPNQAGRKYHRSTLMTLPDNVTALTLNVTNDAASWEWELPSEEDGAGAGSAGENGPEPTAPGSAV
jgi:hypothetical protein